MKTKLRIREQTKVVGKKTNIRAGINDKKSLLFWRILFTVYMIVLVIVLVLKFPTSLVINSVKSWSNGGIVIRVTPNFIPLKTIIEYVKNVHSLTDWFFKNLVCNFVMFLPYGFLRSILTKYKTKKFLKIVVEGCLLSSAIEVIQYITAFGQMDIDDVILNSIGVMIGCGIYNITARIFS